MKVRIGDITLAYDDSGGGMPVVLLHGFPHDRSIWSAQLRGLSGQCRCIAPDLRGFGESDVAPPYSMDQYADDVALLLDALRIERAVIAGLSMGGYVTLAFWRRHAERVLALILADTRAPGDTAESAAKRRELAAVAKAHGGAAVADAMIAGMIGKRTRQRHPELVTHIHGMLASAPTAGVIGALDALVARPDSTATLATIDVPTLIVVGEDDALTPVADARALHAGIADSALEILKGAGHLSNVERPAAFNHVAIEFLREVAGK